MRAISTSARLSTVTAKRVAPGAQAKCFVAPSASVSFISTGIASLRPVEQRTASVRARASTVSVQASEEISYIMIKPDGVQRGLVGEIIARFERKGFTLRGLKMMSVPRSLAEEHYKDLSAKPFFKDLVDYICSGPVVCMIWGGKGVVKSARTLLGATNPIESAPGTIRGDFAVEVGRNVCHGSDSIENGEREVNLWFGKDAAIQWTPADIDWKREVNRA